MESRKPIHFFIWKFKLFSFINVNYFQSIHKAICAKSVNWLSQPLELKQLIMKSEHVNWEH